jgi:N6-adenosine-specific RNA methylase IME4
MTVDPPWAYAVSSDKGKGRSSERHYRTMTIDQMAALPIGALGARHSHLFLWINGPSLVQGLHLPLLEAWGYRPSAVAFVWLKSKKGTLTGDLFFHLGTHQFAMGMGHTTRQNAEFVILGRRGEPQRKTKAMHQLIIEPRRQHSRKPEEFYRRVEAYADGPYLDVFARSERPGWTAWGDQTDHFRPPPGGGFP